MFRRTALPRLQFNAASSTQVETFSAPHQESSIVINYESLEDPVSNSETSLGKSTNGEIVQLTYSTSPVKAQSFNLIYRF